MTTSCHSDGGGVHAQRLHDQLPRKAVHQHRQDGGEASEQPDAAFHAEDDESCVTHPDIVRRIAKAYKLTKDQRTMMLPPNHRPGKDYDPDRYKEMVDPRG